VEHPLQELTIGTARIPVQIYEGPGRRRRKIVYRPRHLVVCVPLGDGVEGALEFLRAREPRVLDGWREVRERHGRIADPGDGHDSLPQGVLFRGTKRWLNWTWGERLDLRYDRYFRVRRADADTDDQVRAAVIEYLQFRARMELGVLAEEQGRRLGVSHGGVEVGELGARWGRVRKDGTLAFPWRLIHAPKASLEYAVIHLLGHLENPFHCEAFDAFIRRECKARQLNDWWLDRNAWLLDPTDGDRL